MLEYRTETNRTEDFERHEERELQNGAKFDASLFFPLRTKTLPIGGSSAVADTKKRKRVVKRDCQLYGQVLLTPWRLSLGCSLERLPYLLSPSTGTISVSSFSISTPFEFAHTRTQALPSILWKSTCALHASSHTRLALNGHNRNGGDYLALPCLQFVLLNRQAATIKLFNSSRYDREIRCKLHTLTEL